MGTKSAETSELHVAFLPFMSPGHLIPTLDIVRLFAARDHVKTTIITTPLNARTITSLLEKLENGIISKISVYTIPFPSKEAGLPDGIENYDQVTSVEMSVKFFLSIELFRAPVERFLEETRPDCLVAGLFFPFATDLATKFGIPTLICHGVSFFAKRAMEVVHSMEPQKSVSTNEEEFILPNLPHEVKLTRSQIRESRGNEEDDQVARFIAASLKASMKSYGEIFNSFYELEPDYVNVFRNVLKRKVWHIGPVSLSNRKMVEKFLRGKKAAISEHDCLKWLDSKEPNSVIYVCFGSSTNISGPQLKQIALALDCAGHPFIWVVKQGIKDSECLPDGFEKRVDGRGLIIKGWAPQVLILEHQAIGSFVTHCGWNSTLEAVSAGVPMVTWPMYAEQFYNEKLVTDVLMIGVQVGSKVWSVTAEGTFLKQEEIEVALKQVMEGDKALEMRVRSKELKDLAMAAVKDGGSSYCDLTSLLHHLVSCKPASKFADSISKVSIKATVLMGEQVL